MPSIGLACVAPAELLERRAQVGVLHDLVDDAPGGDAGAGHDQRYPDVGVEGGLLAFEEAVLAEVVPVVGAEDDVGVVRQVLLRQRRLGVGEELVD